MRLTDRLRQQRFASPAQEAFLNVLVTANWAQGETARVLAPYALTPAQYNVLRILRGSHPTPLPCSAIGERLVDRTPDVTRLLDRLERAGLLSRTRAAHDRRVVEVSVTDAGLALLATVEPHVTALFERVSGTLSDADFRTLSDLLERMRAGEEG